MEEIYYHYPSTKVTSHRYNPFLEQNYNAFRLTYIQVKIPAKLSPWIQNKNVKWSTHHKDAIPSIPLMISTKIQNPRCKTKTVQKIADEEYSGTPDKHKMQQEQVVVAEVMQLRKMTRGHNMNIFYMGFLLLFLVFPTIYPFTLSNWKIAIQPPFITFVWLQIQYLVPHSIFVHFCFYIFRIILTPDLEILG